MGIRELGATVLTRYKADTDDAKRKLKELRGQERERAKELLDGLEAQNRKIDAQIERWGKIAAGVGGVVAVVAALGKGLSIYEEQLRLSTATAGTNVEALQGAFNGLVTETQAMSFAAQALHSDFGTTQADLQTAAKFALVLRSRGVSLAEAFDRVKQAITEANTDALEEFGITIDAQSATTDAYRKIIARMGKEVSEASGNLTQATDDIQRGLVTARDATHDFGVALGKLAVQLTPVVAKLAEAIDHLGGFMDFVGGGGTIGEILSPLGPAAQEKVYREFLQMAKASGIGGAAGILRYHDTGLAKGRGFELHRDDEIKLLRGLVEQELKYQHRIAQIRDKRQTTIMEGAASFVGAAGDFLGQAIAQSKQAIAEKKAKKEQEDKDHRARGPRFDGITHFSPSLYQPHGLSSVSGDVEAGAIGAAAAGASPRIAALHALMDQEGALTASWMERLENRTPQQKFLEGLFGPIEQFDVYGRAFGALTDATTSAYSAWIDGSMSIGDAIKNSLSQSIAAVGSEMAVKALQHAAYAAGSLAFLDFRGAAQHAAAAALFGAGAVTAGVVAKSLGHSGGSAPSAIPGGHPPVLPASGPAARGDRRPVVVIVGDDIDDDPRRRRQRIYKTVQRGLAQSGSGTVEYH